MGFRAARTSKSSPLIRCSSASDQRSPAGFSPDKAHAAFGIAESFDPNAAIAMGNVVGGGDPQEGKALAETVFSGTWGVAAALG